MLQELAEEIDSIVPLVKQWPKKVKAINKVFAAEAKARALDPKVAKRLEDLEADSAKLKKILSTLGM
jgi:ABC-type hemin transport system substrate-binding protein